MTYATRRPLRSVSFGSATAPLRRRTVWVVAGCLVAASLARQDAQGQPTVQAGLSYDAATEALVVTVRTTGDLSGEQLTGAVVTLRYPTADGTTLGEPTGAYGLALQGAPFGSGPHTYLVYTTNQVTLLPGLDAPGAEVEFVRVPVTAGAGTSNQVELAPRGTAPQLADPDEFTFETDGVNFRDDFDDPYFTTSTALPVELTGFAAHRDGDDVVLLVWQTASETNNAGFDVECAAASAAGAAARSSLPWEPIRFVEGRGTTAEATSYAYRVSGLAPGTYRFRLKQIDYDGTAAYSPEVEATVALAAAYHLAPAYPNPFNPQTTFALAVRRAQHVRVAVYDVLGREVALLHEGTLEADRRYRLTFEAGRLGSGTYLIRAAGEDFAAVRAVILAK